MGAFFQINADWAGGNYGPIIAYLTLEANSTQTLRIYKRTSDAAMAEILSVPNLANRFIEMRWVIDPGPNTVAVWVDGVHRGTLRYTVYSATGSERQAFMGRVISAAQFDSVSIRVGT
jgi:hypothetical protein